MDEKLAALRTTLRDYGHLLVAFSGGVDSTFVLRVALDELGDNVVALTTRSPTAVDDDLALAVALTSEWGVRHLVVDANELDIPGYAANPPNRCYFCKDRLYDICRDQASKLGIVHIVDGVNHDDLGDYRPGLQAASERAVRHPLADVGLTKAEIRAASRDLGLPTWDKPSSPCLSSRFPYGTEITLDALRRVGAAERVLHRLGFRECRVRFHDPIARLEVPGEELSRLASADVREVVLRELQALGFRYVTMDLQGFRSGSLNEGLAASSRTTRPSADRPLS